MADNISDTSDITPLLARSPTPSQLALLRAGAVSPPLLRPKMANRMSSSGPAPRAPLNEKGTTNRDAMLRDVTLGFSDGLTVPFALTAGLSIVGSTKIVIMGGLAELFSGMISMGLGAYNAGITERQHWEAEYARTMADITNTPGPERAKVYQILSRYGVTRAAAEPLVRELTADRETWVCFKMDFGLRLPEPDAGRAWISAATMGLSYFVGGLVPMLPYFFTDDAQCALFISIAISAVILLAFGFLKTWVSIRNKKAGFWGALQTLIIGAIAAGTSYEVVRLVDSMQG